MITYLYHVFGEFGKASIKGNQFVYMFQQDINHIGLRETRQQLKKLANNI